jgi:hypothetical protein
MIATISRNRKISGRYAYALQKKEKQNELELFYSTTWRMTAGSFMQTKAKLSTCSKQACQLIMDDYREQMVSNGIIHHLLPIFISAVRV